MNTPNVSISIIGFILILSCSKPHPIPEVTEDPCLNGGQKSVPNGSPISIDICICPDGFCGELCETKGSTINYGNYEGIMVCKGDSIATQFAVVEYECDYISFDGAPSQDRLLFNDGELIAKYWKTYENTGFDQEWIPLNPGEIAIHFGDIEFYNPVNGRLTSDSLSFWVLEFENSPDTCFYVGVKI